MKIKQKEIKIGRWLFSTLLFLITFTVMGLATLISNTQVAVNITHFLNSSGFLNATRITDQIITITGGDITGADDINGTDIFVTNAYITNLEKNLDGTGFTITAGTFTDGTCSITGGDITSVDDMNSTDVYITGEFSDGTGTITGGDLTGFDDINATDVFITNLYSTNLEKNLDGTGFTITAGTFTDGTCSITGGDITSVDDMNSTDVYITGEFSDGTGTITGGDLTGWDDINGTDVFVTNAYITNLEKNLDGTGFTITAGTFTDGTISITGGDLIGADDINGTDLFVTNIDATNYNLVEGDIPSLTSSWGNTIDAELLTDVSDLNNLITLYGENITAGTINNARLPSSITMTGNLTMSTGNITIAQSHWICLDGSTCTHKIYFNGTHTIIE